MDGLYKRLPAESAKLPNRACSAGRSLYGPSMSYVLGFQTKIYLESLRNIRLSWAVNFAVPFNFIRFLISALCLHSGISIISCLGHRIWKIERKSFPPIRFFSKLLKPIHSALIRNLIKLKGTAKLTAQSERVCVKDFKYVLNPRK